MSFAAAEADRRISQIVQIGVVTAIGGGTARMRVGDIVTHDLPVGQVAMGATKIRTMPSVGEQRLVFAPGGDMARAVIGPAIAASNTPGDPNEHTVIELGGELRITGDLVIEGDIRLTGTVTADTEVIAQGVSLTTHVHPGVATGPATTGEPE